MQYSITRSDRQLLVYAWWRHQLETFSALLAICAGNSPITGEFPAQKQVTQSFDAFFDLRLNKRLSKQWWGWWFETPSSSLWGHRNGEQTVPSMPNENHMKTHYIDVIMTTITSQITSITIVYLTVYSDANQRKHQSSALLAFVCGIHRDRWIPRTKGQLRGKCFHLMTSSCNK